MPGERRLPDLEMKPESTLRRAVPRILSKRLRRLLAGAQEALASGRADDLHAVRIAGKHLRYNLEFFRSILGPAGDIALELLAQLQERLGTIADLDAFARDYNELLASLDKSDPRVAGLRARLRAVRREREHALETLRQRWSRGETYPERLVASISAAVDSLSSNGGG